VHPDPLARATPLGVAFGTVAADDGLGRLLDEHGAARAGGCEWQTEDQPAGAEPVLATNAIRTLTPVQRAA